MKKLLITLIAISGLAIPLSAQAPIQYSVARQDDTLQQYPTVPGNVWGGSTGAGTKWCNPNYENLCIWRLTDATVFQGAVSVQVPDNEVSNSVQTTDSQTDNIVSVPNGSARYIIGRSTGGNSRIIAFDSSQSTATAVGSVLAGDFMFDEKNAGVIYARLNNTQIVKYTSSNGWSTYTTQAIYDFANCLPSGFQVTWDGTWATATISANTGGPVHTFGIAFSNSGGQGTGNWITVYQDTPGTNCASIDTLHSLAYGWNGQLLGPLDDGNGNSIPAFTIHDGGMTRNPAFVDIAPAASCQNCASAYIWQVGTDSRSSMHHSM